MEVTNNLKLPLLVPNQSQKEVTHNEALVILDNLLHNGVKDKDLITPPLSPQTNDVYIIPTGATDEWYERDSQIAFYDNGWRFLQAREGSVFWVNDENCLYVFNGTGWVKHNPDSVGSQILDEVAIQNGDTSYTFDGLNDGGHHKIVFENLQVSTDGVAMCMQFGLNDTIFTSGYEVNITISESYDTGLTVLSQRSAECIALTGRKYSDWGLSVSNTSSVQIDFLGDYSISAPKILSFTTIIDRDYSIGIMQQHGVGLASINDVDRVTFYLTAGTFKAGKVKHYRE